MGEPERKKMRLRIAEFIAAKKEDILGKQLEVEGGAHRITGKATLAEGSAMFGTEVATIRLENRNTGAYAKLGYLGDVYETRSGPLRRIQSDAEAIALLATAGNEIEGRITHLHREDGTGMIARLSIQRETKAIRDPKQFLRLAALTRLTPRAIGKGDEYIIVDTRPENVGKHGAFDLYIGRKRRAKQLEQIHTHRDAADFMETYGAQGIRALVQTLRAIDERRYRRYIQRLEKNAKNPDRKLVAKALAAALRDYPKTERFWQELAEDLKDILWEARRYYPGKKSTGNIERQIEYLKRGKDPYHVRAWHAGEIMKNLLKLWLVKQKRMGFIRSQSGGAPQRPFEPSRRP